MLSHIRMGDPSHRPRILPLRCFPRITSRRPPSFASRTRDAIESPISYQIVLVGEATNRVEHLDSEIDARRLPSDSDQSLVLIDGRTRLGGSTGLGNANLTLALRANLVDFDSAFTDDYRCLSVRGRNHEHGGEGQNKGEEGVVGERGKGGSGTGGERRSRGRWEGGEGGRKGVGAKGWAGVGRGGLEGKRERCTAQLTCADKGVGNEDLLSLRSRPCIDGSG